MIKLHGPLPQRWAGEPFVARVAADPGRPAALHGREALLAPPGATQPPAGFRAYLRTDGSQAEGESAGGPVVDLPASLGHLADGDVVRVNPAAGQVWVMYR